MSKLISVYLDTETTANTRNEPIEISYIAVIPDARMEIQKYLKPEEPCLPCATVVHGLSEKFLSEQIPIADGLEEATIDLFNNIESYAIIGYNVEFDTTVINSACSHYLDKEYNPSCVIDVMKIAKKMIPINEVGKYSLDAVYNYLMPDKLEELLEKRSSHSALVDCDLTRQVFRKLLPMAFPDSKPSLTEIMEYANAPIIIDVWPFGKHKGVPIEKVMASDKQYANWFMYKADFRDSWADLVFTLREKHGYK